MYLFSPLSFFSLAPLFLLLALSLRHQSVMMIIMILETLTISLIGFVMFFHALDMSMSIFMLLLFAGCQAAAGLALLVNLIRRTGNDQISSLSNLKC